MKKPRIPTLLLSFILFLVPAIAFCSEQESEAITDYMGKIFYSLFFSLYAIGMMIAIISLIREKKERLSPLATTSSTTSGGQDANRKAETICRELDQYPPVNNRGIARQMHRKIQEAASLGPTDPQVLTRLNTFIQKLNTATKREFVFPGISTEEKHGCAIPLLASLTFISITGQLFQTDLPIWIIPVILVIIFSGVVISAMTPEYQREAINKSFIFRVFSFFFVLSGSLLTLAYKMAHHATLYEYTPPFGKKKYFIKEPSAMEVLITYCIAGGVCLVLLVFSYVLLMPLTIYFFCRNYLFVSAQISGAVAGNLPIEKERKAMLIILAIAGVAATLAVFFLTGGKGNNTFGAAIWLLSLQFFPECFFAHFNCLVSAASVLPEQDRSRALNQINTRSAIGFAVYLLLALCWGGFMTVAIILS